MDVTVPVQALVNASQLYIPGIRSKVSPRLAGVRVARSPAFPVRLISPLLFDRYPMPGSGAFCEPFLVHGAGSRPPPMS